MCMVCPAVIGQGHLLSLVRGTCCHWSGAPADIGQRHLRSEVLTLLLGLECAILAPVAPPPERPLQPAADAHGVLPVRLQAQHHGLRQPQPRGAKLHREEGEHR